MQFIIIIFSFFIGLFGGLVSNNYSTAQSKASDTERQTDINAIYQKLEEHFNEYGDYPTVDELTVGYSEKLPGLDPEALIDPNGNRIQLGDYTYEPVGCNAVGCAQYVLSATLEDGTGYTKDSLN